MNNVNVNITPEDILAQKTAETPIKKEKKVFDPKNYLQARLSDKETTKTLTIRLLPFSPDGGSPFHKVHMHQVRVNKEISASGWKTFPCPISNHLGDSCPYCETSLQAKKLKENSAIEQEKKKYGEIEFANKARDMWVVRCIERGHEEDGVKFWLFSSSKKGDGAYDKIYNIFLQRYKKAMEQGKYNNIFDLYEGKDLFLTLSKDTNNKTVINVADDDEKSPLSTSNEQIAEWVNDTKQWTDVYTLKPYDYMAIVLQGGVPRFDKEKGCYVDKAEANAEAEAEIERNLSHPSRDLSIEEDKTNVTESVTNKITNMSPCIIDDEEDLPF